MLCDTGDRLAETETRTQTAGERIGDVRQLPLERPQPSFTQPEVERAWRHGGEQHRERSAIQARQPTEHDGRDEQHDQVDAQERGRLDEQEQFDQLHLIEVREMATVMPKRPRRRPRDSPADDRRTQADRKRGYPERGAHGATCDALPH